MLNRLFNSAKNFKAKKTYKDLLGFKPSDVSLYKEALTHKSANIVSLDSKKISNERLEFLGDAVLGLIIAEILYTSYPEKDEGFLTEGRSRLVNREMLNKLGYHIKLQDWLISERKDNPKIDISDAMIGNAFEALIGAIYIDKGYKKTMQFFKNILKTHRIDISQTFETNQNYKSKLLEWGQKSNHKVEFLLLNTQRENQLLMYEISVQINGEEYGKSISAKKKKAEQECAKMALKKLRID